MKSGGPGLYDIEDLPEGAWYTPHLKKLKRAVEVVGPVEVLVGLFGKTAVKVVIEWREDMGRVAMQHQFVATRDDPEIAWYSQAQKVLRHDLKEGAAEAAPSGGRSPRA